MPPFPPPPISPLVSQSGSPIQSRSTSPHRTSVRQPPLLPTPIQSLDALTTQLPMDPLSLSSRQLFTSDTKLSDEEVCFVFFVLQFCNVYDLAEPLTRRQAPGSYMGHHDTATVRY